MAHPSEPNAAFDALLFDMDGTVLTSIDAAERVWTRWARRHGLDVDAFLPTIHGKRAIDTVRDAGVVVVTALHSAAASTAHPSIPDYRGVTTTTLEDGRLRVRLP